MSPLALRARTLITAADEAPVPDAVVVVEGGLVTAVGAWQQLRDGLTEVVDVDGVLMPGLVDAHSHLRGLPLDDHGIPARQFESWICSLSGATALDPHDEALVAATGLLETGVTAVQGFLDAGAVEAGALEGAQAARSGIVAAGIRALLVLGFADRALRSPEPAEGEWELVAGNRETLPVASIPAVSRAWLAQPGGIVQHGIGPVGGQWSSDGLLEAIAASVGDHRLHTHLHESRLHRHWLAGTDSPLDRLEAAGMLDQRLSGAHGVHLLDDELDRIARSGACLVHCPVSNDALRVGTAGVSRWLARGIPAGLGIDSQNVGAPDMFDVMRAALSTSQAAGEPITPLQAFGLATTGGSAALGIPGGGRIAVGSPADLVALGLGDTDVTGIVSHGSAAAVRSVWVAGRAVVADGASVVDSAPARERLTARLREDRDAREARIHAHSALLDTVERLAEARS